MIGLIAMQRSNINFLTPILILVSVGVLYGILTSFSYTLQLSLMGLIVLSILLMCYWKHLKTILLVFGIFLLFEPLISLNLENVNSTLELGVKRSPEAFILVFFALLAFGDRISIQEDNTLLIKALDNFWVFIITVIGFYFGGRSLEKAAEKYRKDPKKDS